MAKHLCLMSKTISIHAPTRGATSNGTIKQRPRAISIHAPTRGATQTVLQGLVLSLYFNPRSHEGSDDFDLDYTDYEDISIHAPTRGATFC